ncbi:MAG: deoxyguanosinetriphosphate triphosphohydrolase [Gammaproteobacteria bacterium]
MTMDWQKLLNSNRLRRPPDKPHYNVDLPPFFEDQDRIIFSQPFRRLQYKTQVHPLVENDHVRTRLTHSMEVGTIGYALGAFVGREIVMRHNLKDTDEHDIGLLVQSACYGHDIGNPPFGHVGEEAIKDWFVSHPEIFDDSMTEAECKDLINFEGNAQGFRILTQIENYKWDGGMQLTYATLATFMKYPWGSHQDPYGKGKFSFFQSEKGYAADVADRVGMIMRDSGGWYRHPLAYLVEAADDICYALIDLEDGIEMGALSVEEYTDLFKVFLDTEHKKRDYKRFDDDVQRISFLRSKAISTLVKQASEAFLDNERDILNGRFHSELLTNVSDRDFIRKAKQISEDKVFKHSKKVYVEISSFTVIGGLLEALVEACIENPDKTKSGKIRQLMGRMRPASDATRYETLLRITDFISGMTDRFATGMYRQTTGISAGSMTPAPNSLS